MKNQSKFLIGGIVAVVVIAGTLFATNTNLLKGSLGAVNEPITRAQLAELIAEELIIGAGDVYKIDVSTTKDCFNDIAGLSASQQYAICFLNKNGLLYGISDTTDIGLPTKDFKPQTVVNRAKAAVALWTTFGNYLPVKVNVKYKPYSDVSETDWFVLAVENLAANDILDTNASTKNKFYPSKPLTFGRAKSWIKKINLQ